MGCREGRGKEEGGRREEEVRREGVREGKRGGTDRRKIKGSEGGEGSGVREGREVE